MSLSRLWFVMVAAVVLSTALSEAMAVDLAEGLVAEWTFEEVKGDVVRDTSDNNNNAVLHGPVRVKDGIGTALRFDGVDDYVDCGSTASLDITRQVSLEAWVCPEKPSLGEPIIVGKGIYSYALTWSGTSLMFYISAGHWKCNTELPMGKWSHVVGTYDGNRMRLYVDGEPVSGFVMPEPGTPIASRGGSAVIGSEGAGGGRGFFCGMVDNVRIYNRPLSEAEIRSHYDEEHKKIALPSPVPRERLTGLALRVYDLGQGPATVKITGTEAVESDVTIPSGVRISFEMGGCCDVKEGVTLTIAGPVEAPIARIFSGGGKVVFEPGSVEQVYPQWWGARGDGKTDDAPAIQSAIASLPRGGTVKFLNGTYRVGETIRFHSGISLVGPATLWSKRKLPAVLQSANPQARSGSVLIERLSINGRGADGETCDVGIDFTNTCYSVIERTSVSSCTTGILLDGPIFCGYNNMYGLSIGGCKVGIEFRNSAIKTSLIGSNIGAVDTGVLVTTANELDIFGLSIEGFREVGIDVQRGDTVHMHHLYFANGTESGTGIRIAREASECTVLNPRYSRVAAPVENASGTTLILDETEPSDLLRTKALFARGISGSDVPARNMRGSVTIAGASTEAAVTFGTPEEDANYFVTATAVSGSGTPARGSLIVFVKDKTTAGFKICLAEAPGEGNTVQVDWIMVR